VKKIVCIIYEMTLVCYTKSVTLKTTKLGTGNTNYADCFQFRSVLQNMTSN